MKSERLLNVSHVDWPSVWAIYEVSFPQNERRTLDAQQRVFSDQVHYFFELWRDDDGVPVGLTASWEYPTFRFLEHFAVDPNRRSGGFGRTIFSQWLLRPGPVAILEIDPVTDDISTRRWNFYQKHGCLKNDFRHGHPSYRDGTGQVPMWLLSHPGRIDEALYREFLRLELENLFDYL